MFAVPEKRDGLKVKINLLLVYPFSVSLADSLTLILTLTNAGSVLARSHSKGFAPLGSAIMGRSSPPLARPRNVKTVSTLRRIDNYLSTTLRILLLLYYYHYYYENYVRRLLLQQLLLLL